MLESSRTLKKKKRSLPCVDGYKPCIMTNRYKHPERPLKITSNIDQIHYYSETNIFNHLFTIVTFLKTEINRLNNMNVRLLEQNDLECNMTQAAKTQIVSRQKTARIFNHWESNTTRVQLYLTTIKQFTEQYADKEITREHYVEFDPLPPDFFGEDVIRYCNPHSTYHVNKMAIERLLIILNYFMKMILIHEKKK